MPTFASDSKGARVAIIERGRAEGRNWEQIAEEVGNITGKGLACWWATQTRAARREKARSYMRKPDAPQPGTTRRACLRCQKMFDSEGAHNRLCQPCKGNR